MFCPIARRDCEEGNCPFWLVEGEKQGCTLVGIARTVDRECMKGNIFKWPELKPGEHPIIASYGERVLSPKEKQEKAE
jgi:hypothetical protein